MSKIVEYMNEIGLTNFDNIQDYFFNSNLETIISLHEYLQELAYEDWSISDYSPYSFAPSMELCGFGGCEEYHCKLQRASVFNKFASLYGDTVYFIVNSITNPHIPDFFDDKHNEFEYRYHLMSDCSLIFLYSELIVRNIAKIIPPHFSICPDCFAKCICNEDALLSLNPISQKYSEKAVLEVIEYNSKTKNGCIVIKNLPELFPNHDAYVNVYGEYGTNVMEQIKSFPSIITDKTFLSHFIQRYVEDCYITSRFETFISSAYRSKYITDKPIHKEILSTNKITASLTPPVFEMPFLENVDTDTILKLRDSEQDSFNEYRIALDKATQAYLATTQTTEASDIYDDIIYPAFVKLDTMFKRSRKMQIFKNIGELLVTSATVTLGVMNSVIPENALAIITAVGGTEAMAKYITSTIERKLTAGNTIENQDFYFLWKLNRKK